MINKTLFDELCTMKQEELAQIIAKRKLYRLGLCGKLLNHFADSDMIQDVTLEAILDYKLSNGYTQTYDHKIRDMIMEVIKDESK